MPWENWEALDPAGKKQRNDADVRRPCLSSDELNQYINQSVNGVRQNPRAVHFAPTGNGANDKGAEFYQNHTREIEYRSHAQMADCTAFSDAVTLPPAAVLMALRMPCTLVAPLRCA